MPIPGPRTETQAISHARRAPAGGGTILCSGRSSRTRSLHSDCDRSETIEETTGAVYGGLLRALARRGYLPFPEPC